MRLLRGRDGNTIGCPICGQRMSESPLIDGYSCNQHGLIGRQELLETLSKLDYGRHTVKASQAHTGR